MNNDQLHPGEDGQAGETGGLTRRNFLGLAVAGGGSLLAEACAEKIDLVAKTVDQALKGTRDNFDDSLDNETRKKAERAKKTAEYKSVREFLDSRRAELEQELTGLGHGQIRVLRDFDDERKMNALIEFLEYVASARINEAPDYKRLQSLLPYDLFFALGAPIDMLGNDTLSTSAYGGGDYQPSPDGREPITATLNCWNAPGDLPTKKLRVDYHEKDRSLDITLSRDGFKQEIHWRFDLQGTGSQRKLVPVQKRLLCDGRSLSMDVDLADSQMKQSYSVGVEEQASVKYGDVALLPVEYSSKTGFGERKDEVVLDSDMWREDVRELKGNIF